MNKSKKGNVSPNVVRRMPRYLRKLDELSAAGISRISSGELGRQLGLTPSQIRQDFSCFGEFGQQGYGYKVTALRGEIASILGMDRGYTAVLVGVGNLGHALMCNFDFAQWGLDLKAAFDVNPAVVGTQCNNVEIHHVDTLESYLAENHIDIAVLCVPKSNATAARDRLVGCGVNAFWNFTNIELKNPGDTDNKIVVENMHFSDSLLSLNYFLSEKLDSDAAEAAKAAKLAK